MSSFAVGLLIGQISVLLVMAVVIRFVIFADSPNFKGSPAPTDTKVEVQPTKSQTVEELLEQTYYNVDTHAAESMDWCTVLVALILRSMREQAVAQDNLLNALNTMLASDKVPSFIDAIKITELDLGSDFPLLNNCRVYRTNPSAHSNGIEIRFDIDLKDTITLGIDTRLTLNYPKPTLAYLPLSAAVSILSFSGRVSISLVADDIDGSQFLTVMFAPNFSMEFRVTSLLGARSKLQNVPKLGQLVESTIRRRFIESCVAPNFQRIKLPGWKVSKKPNDTDVAAAGTTNVATVTATAAAAPLATVLDPVNSEVAPGSPGSPGLRHTSGADVRNSVRLRTGIPATTDSTPTR